MSDPTSTAAARQQDRADPAMQAGTTFSRAARAIGCDTMKKCAMQCDSICRRLSQAPMS